MRLHLPLICHHTSSYRIHRNRCGRETPPDWNKSALPHRLPRSIVMIFRSLHSNITFSRPIRGMQPGPPLHAILTDQAAFLNVIGEKLCSRPKLPQSGRMCPSPKPLGPPMTSAQCVCSKVPGRKSIDILVSIQLLPQKGWLQLQNLCSCSRNAQSQ